MRIGIDARPIREPRSGVGWHTFNLLRALVDLKDDIEFVCYVNPGGGGWSRDRELLGQWALNERVRWVESGRAMMRWRGGLDRLDLYHGTNFKLQTLGRYGGVVTIHDLWLDRYPQYSKKLFGQRISFLKTRRTARKARKIITVSEHSAKDIEDLYGLPRDLITVIPNGVSAEFYPDTDPSGRTVLRTQFGLPTDQFILFVGGADPRKNHRTLLEAYARVSSRLKQYVLVMVGDPEHRNGNIQETAHSLGLTNRVVCTGRRCIDELRLLYSHAAVFVFPSIYEGFGMPVLEAMACSVPVISSNTTSLPEVAGEAAVLVDPKDPQGIAEAMVRVVESPTLRESLKTKGFERVRAYSWEIAARRTLQIYREICEASER